MARAQAAASLQVTADENRAGPGAPVTAMRRPVRGAAGWARAVRVRQWPKNVLVFGAPAAAGALTQPRVLERAGLAAVAFCLLSSGAYLINDLHDAREDRNHPIKRHRPIASGAIRPGPARLVALLALVGGLGVAAVLGAATVAVAAGYAGLNFAYTGWLRRVAVADIAAIAGAFVLRAAAGGIAAGVPISRWFFVVVSFSALFVAAGKRYADWLDPAARGSRRVLADYNGEFLRLVLAASSAVALGAYCLWAFRPGQPGALVWREATIAPFTLALLRYGLLVTGGRGGAPEEIMLSDRFIQLCGGVWLVTFALGL
ncbi:MAG: decaprenyl-phosphate phosphoribosyltransferase [Solirubrobacteraceae bacterium]|jgi:decaprenyl-phosphate phosphoribosyltransferase|nr:decaprenyl-phosphate phosphoribosyltransferase [Solirubrobacteraceae bacterium]